MCKIAGTKDSYQIGLELAWSNSNGINDRYSDEEIMDLVGMLGTRELGGLDLIYRWKVNGGGVRIDGLRLVPEACECFLAPLDSMPLYINHPHEETQTVAAWRLKWAK